jgi:hypothetical protein
MSKVHVTTQLESGAAKRFSETMVKIIQIGNFSPSTKNATTSKRCNRNGRVRQYCVALKWATQSIFANRNLDRASICVRASAKHQHQCPHQNPCPYHGIYLPAFVHVLSQCPPSASKARVRTSSAPAAVGIRWQKMDKRVQKRTKNGQKGTKHKQNRTKGDKT